MTYSPLQALSDADLARRCRRGDEQAWRELVRRTTPTVWRVTSRVLRSPAEAEEVSQEVYVLVVRSFNTFDATRPLTPWIARLAYHASLKRLARRSREGVTLDERAWVMDQPNPEARVAEGEAHRLVELAIARLPAQDRALLTMHYREDLSMAEVAEATGLPTGTIKARLSRARSRLRQFLAPRLGREPQGGEARG
ncbi:sigma-70 family RNA polymerase sigma factor [Myxococcota bacterium]|nr:sigma-70 family RNA polymerase sigma factor [Myxococcota bacterium]MBU1430226.1 sigma-70 family RNA polymerase sigma factor [Myxococcota bacterium]MBU1896722.1 sigma-70 family RNA polymerase sigma factor [Myxococcota bacterium]